MNELRAIRPSDSDIDAEFTPERREEVYQQVLAAASRNSARRRGLWLVAAGVAAAVVTAVAFTIPPLLNRDANSTQVADPVPASTAPVASPTMRTPQTPSGPSLVLYDPGTVVPPSALSDVAEAAAGVDTVQAGQGGFLHVVEVSSQTGEYPIQTVRESYIDVEGWSWVHQTTDQGEDDWWLFPPYQTDAPLPTDPAALDQVLRSGAGNNSDDERVFKGINEVLESNQASPALRSAAIRALQNLAENPQDPAPDEEGVLATPKLEVAELTLPDGTLGYRVTYTDVTSRPGMSHEMVLDGSGQLLETTQTFDGSDPDNPVPSSYTSQTQIREQAMELPGDFVSVLGTEHVEQN